MTAEPSDTERRELFERASQGDPRALDSLVEQYLPQLRAFVRLRMDQGLRVREACSDLVQSVCREVLGDRQHFEFRGEAQFRGWLFKAALHKLAEKQRFHHRERRDVAREAAPPSQASMAQLAEAYGALGSPSQAAVRAEDIARLEAALDQLPEDYREVIAMARLLGLPHDEIANQMGRSVGAVRQLLGRAILKLGELMEEPRR